MIDFTITACDEYDELKGLIYYLKRFLIDTDNILVFLDGFNTNQNMRDLVIESGCKLCEFDCVDFRSKFLFQKSKLTNKIVFGLCADEVPTIPLLYEVRKLAKADLNGVDVIAVPRMNIFSDIHTLEDKPMYTGDRPPKYLLDEPITQEGWHCWPDYQVRLWKNLPHITWGETTHTGIIGYRGMYVFPADAKYAILHVKTIARQERILKIYDKIGLG